MSIQPIETHYAGCRFRSRLEARYAVLFDHIGAAWEYEPQGFVVGGRPYLPDFLLKDCGTWIEVKGNSADLDLTLMAKAAVELPEMPFRGQQGPRLLILGSIPPPLAFGDWAWLGLDPQTAEGIAHGADEVFDAWFGFEWFRETGCLADMRETSTAPPYSCSSDAAEWLTPVQNCAESDGVSARAYAAARSARFEHGERG